MNDSTDLTKVREWTDTEGHEHDEDGEWQWPPPPELTEWLVTGNMRADVLAKIGRAPDDPAEVHLIETTTEGGWSEYTREIDYDVEVWVHDGRQQQRVFDATSYDHEGVAAAFLRWITP